MEDVYNHLREEEKHETDDDHYDHACAASCLGTEPPPAFIVAYHEVHKSMILNRSLIWFEKWYLPYDKHPKKVHIM